MKAQRIGIILPAYNEALVLGKVLRSIPKTLVIRKNRYELVPVVVDDGSTDKTAAIAAKYPRGVLIRHLINSGPGAATRTGLRYLRDNNFLFGATMDADGQHTAKDLTKVLEAAIANKGDFIVGSRLINTRGMPRYKIVGNKGLSLITRLLLGVKSTDSQSGLKAFNRHTIDNLTFHENGYAFCSEMLWRADRMNLRITEIPIKAIYTSYSQQKGQSSWSGFQIIKQLLKHRLGEWVHE